MADSVDTNGHVVTVIPTSQPNSFDLYRFEREANFELIGS